MAVLTHDREIGIESAMLPRFAYVSKVFRENADTTTLEVVAADGVSEFQFEPGQFHMLGFPGIGEVPISVSGDPGKPRLLIHTIRDVGAISHWLAHRKVHDPLTVRGPFGVPWPMAEAKGKDLLLVAGGIGLAPLRPVIYHVLNHRSDYGRIVVLYGTRSSRDIMFRRELKKWRGRFDMTFSLTVDHPGAGWHSNVGVVTKLIWRAPLDPNNCVAMVCGPEIMMRYSGKELIRRGVPDTAIFFSLERNMKCGIGLCGHCQIRHEFTCLTGPVYRYDEAAEFMEVHEL